MAMVFGLVKQQHGFIDVQSEPGSGTTVSLYFPHVEGGGAERKGAS
jgi:signal transduction histidine kinase